MTVLKSILHIDKRTSSLEKLYLFDFPLLSQIQWGIKFPSWINLIIFECWHNFTHRWEKITNYHVWENGNWILYIPGWCCTQPLRGRRPRRGGRSSCPRWSPRWRSWSRWCCCRGKLRRIPLRRTRLSTRKCVWNLKIHLIGYIPNYKKTKRSL